MIKRRPDDQTAALAVAEDINAQQRGPIYRVYPGVPAGVLRLGIEKIDISKVHPPINGLALELAEGRFIKAGQWEIANLMIAEFGEEMLFIEFVHADGNRGQVKFPRIHQSILEWLETMPEVERHLMTQIMQVVFGVCMIPQSDTGLIKPLVLNRDKEKFEATGDSKYIDRAKRNGVHGWELGRDIPTPEEIAAFREHGGEPGRKSPHWRNTYLAARHTKKGPVVTRIKETFVNKELLKEIPTGYYGKEET